MVHFQSGDISVICLFFAQNFLFHVFLDNGIWASRKIYNINSPKLPLVSVTFFGYNRSRGTISYQVFFGKGKNSQAR